LWQRASSTLCSVEALVQRFPSLILALVSTESTREIYEFDLPYPAEYFYERLLTAHASQRRDTLRASPPIGLKILVSLSTSLQPVIEKVTRQQI
jgi:hypothetical protein